MSDQINFLLDHLIPLLAGYPGQRPGGLVLSLLLAVAGVALGFTLAIVVGSCRLSRFRSLRVLGRAYVEIFRGLPLILLMILTYQAIGPPRFNFDLSPRGAALISLALYSGAYQAEIVRAGLSAVPAQLVESARLMGGTPWQVFFRVKLRYALQTMLPAFAGQAISLFKDTSVVIVIGVSELMTTAREVLGSDITNAPYWVSLYMLVGLLYFVVAFAVSRGASWLESRTQTGDLVHSFIVY